MSLRRTPRGGSVAQSRRKNKIARNLESPKTGECRMSPDSDLEYCAESIRRHDPDRWLTALFAPEARRPGLWALYAFNLELARVAEGVSEPLLGDIRLQWWRDALADHAMVSPRAHPVVRALRERVLPAGATPERLAALIEARAADLDPAPPPTLAVLRAYADATSGELMRLALRVLGVDADAAAREAGIAYALVGLLRALPHHHARGKVYLPQDVLESVGLAEAEVVNTRDRRALRRAVAVVADAASVHLAQARTLARTAPRAAWPALLPARLARLYLRRLQRAGFEPEDPRLSVSRPRKQFALLDAAIRRRL